MEQGYSFFAGVDWATEKHDIAIISDARVRLCDFQVGNSADGLSDLAAKLSAACGGRLETMAVAIETPRGPVVETLVERGFHVFSINPKQLDHFRDRHAPAGSKDDSRV